MFSSIERFRFESGSRLSENRQNRKDRFPKIRFSLLGYDERIRSYRTGKLELK